jgi:hypothetical protein
MTTINKNKKCKRIRAWLHKAVINRLGPKADWVQTHVAGCSKCQRRLASFGKVNLALSIIKSQPHSLDLLMRANAQAVGVLKHSLRQAPKAEKLKAARPEPKLLERSRKYAHPVANAAACVAILLLMKMGVFSSMDKFQSEGRKVARQYYASQIGQDMADDIFSA